MTFGRLLLVVVYFYHSHALLCYRGKYLIHPNQTAQFEEFYKVRCQSKQSCACWSIRHPDSTNFYFGCLKRCRGMNCCREEDMCNSQWIQEYQNRTTERVVINLLPEGPWKDEEHKIYIQKEEEMEPPGPVMKVGGIITQKKLFLKNSTAIWVILIGVVGVCLIAIGGAIFVFCISDSTSPPVIV